MPKRIAILANGPQTEPPRHIAELVSPGFQAELVKPAVTRHPLTPFDSFLSDYGFVEAAMRAAAGGADAILISSYSDSGLDAARSALGIPVVGAGQAVLAMARRLGNRFSIVTVWPDLFAGMYRDHLRRNGVEAQCASIRYVHGPEVLDRLGTPDSMTQQMVRGESEIIAAIIAQCAEAIRDDGADTIVFGCTCMGPVVPQVAAACRAPVLEGSRIGYLETEALLRLGLGQSKIAFPTPKAASLALIQGALAAGGDAVEECPVCVFDAAE
ncbi:MAG: aspartate/glutamate racemase family protein [Rhizomicrobium sp.]